MNESVISPEKEIEQARLLVMYAYSRYIKGSYVPKDQSKPDLVNLEISFKIAEDHLDFEKNSKLYDFRIECLRALGL